MMLYFFLTKLKSSIPNLMTLIENFGEFSGYKINNSKSVLLFLNKEERHKPIINTPFMTTTEGFGYLGVKITPYLNKIIPLNYDPLMDKTIEMLQKWSNLPISMIGRINIIKNVYSTKIFILFSNTPIAFTKHVL